MKEGGSIFGKFQVNFEFYLFLLSNLKIFPKKMGESPTQVLMGDSPPPFNACLWVEQQRCLWQQQECVTICNGFATAYFNLNT